MDKFPHLSDGSFPGISNINVYGMEDYDYSKFANRQMKIKLMSVPWDLGSVHVGLKEVPMGNVVKFDSDEERDAWINSQPGITFETRYRSYHNDDTMKLPIPYENIVPFNYIVIDYDEPPVSYGDMARIKRWLYFIRDIDQESMNSTVCTIARDTWSMFINSVEVVSMVLERGHAPMFAAPTPAEFLESPIDKNDMLLCDDVNYGMPSVSNMCSKFVVNDSEMLCCFATSAYPQGTWSGENTNSWHVPRFISVTQDGNVAPYVFAVPSSKLSDFLHAVDEQAPQFPQTVRGVFFAPKKLVDLSTEFTFCGITCNRLTASNKSFDLDMPTVSDFGFDKEDQKLTKLYTYPYSVLEITDEYGSVTEVRVEDCSGKLTVNACMSLAFPWVNVSANISGIGGKNTNTIGFANLKDRSFKAGGKWYENLMSWDVPVMAIYQGNQRTNDFATYFDRVTEETNTKKSADTEATNSKNSNNTARLNARDAADTDVTNTQVSTAAIKAVNTTTSEYMRKDTKLGNELAVALEAWSAGFAYATLNEEVTVENRNATIAGIGIGYDTGKNYITSINPIDKIKAVGDGAVQGLVTFYNSQTAINYDKATTDIAVSSNKKNMQETNQNNIDRNNTAIEGNTKNVETNTKSLETQSKNSATTEKDNADRTRDTGNANAGRTKDTAYANVDLSIANQNRQAGLMAPNVFGEEANGNFSTTRPMGVFINVVKQPRGAIKQAADQFKRFGYMYNGVWEFDGFNKGKRFTYWKCSDLWMKATSLPDAFADQIRNYLLMGITVWRKPEYINNTTIEENM